VRAFRGSCAIGGSVARPIAFALMLLASVGLALVGA